MASLRVHDQGSPANSRSCARRSFLKIGPVNTNTFLNIESYIHSCIIKCALTLTSSHCFCSTIVVYLLSCNAALSIYIRFRPRLKQSLGLKNSTACQKRSEFRRVLKTLNLGKNLLGDPWPQYAFLSIDSSLSYIHADCGCHV